MGSLVLGHAEGFGEHAIFFQRGDRVQLEGFVIVAGPIGSLVVQRPGEVDDLQPAGAKLIECEHWPIVSAAVNCPSWPVLGLDPRRFDASQAPLDGQPNRQSHRQNDTFSHGLLSLVARLALADSVVDFRILPHALEYWPAR